MSNETLQQSKEKIAQLYIDSFKKELTDFQVNLFSSFEAKVKKLLLSSDDIGDSFQDLPLTDQEKSFLNDDPLLAEKFYLFIKEKREKIATVKTVSELENLSSELPSENSKKTNAIKAGITTSIIGGGTVLGIDKTNKWFDVNHSKNMKKFFNKNVKETTIKAGDAKETFVKMQGQFDDLSKNLKTYSKNPKLTKFMKKNLEKSAKIFKETSEGLTEESISAFEMWSKLGDKLPYSVMKSIKPSQAQALMGLGDDAFETIKATDDIALIKKTLNVGDLSDETIKILKTAKNLDEFKGMTHCLTQVKSIKNVLKGVRGLFLIDLIVLGIDVWSYGESMNEIEEVKKINALRAKYMKNRANAQLVIGIVGTALSIIGGCAAAGSIIPGFGTIIGLAIGAIAFGISRIVDSYYDKVEFYAQNEEDYKKQARTKIKQAIIQTTSAESFGRHEGMRADVAMERAENGQSINIVKDAWSALVWQEEMNNGTYGYLQGLENSGKSEEEYKKELLEKEGGKEEVKKYEEEKKTIYAIINKRLEYIKLYMYETGNDTKIKNFVKAMKGSQGLAFVENILAESKVYYLKSNQGKDQFLPGYEKKSVKEYETAFGEKLKNQNPELFKKLSALCKKDFAKFVELYQGTIYLESFTTKKENTQEAPSLQPVEDVFAEQQPVEDVFAEEVPTESAFTEEVLPEEQKEEFSPLAVENIAYIKRFYEYATLGVPVERLHNLQLAFNDIDYNYIERVLSDINAIDQANVFTSNDAKLYFSGDAILNRAKSNIELSDNVGQNVLYRLAREFHGYTGNNDMLQLMQFYNPGDADSTGIYYDGGWYVNNDWAIDKSFDLNIFNDPKKNASDILKELTNSSNWNYLNQALTPSLMPAIDTYGFINPPSSIDTPTENMDEEMNKEFWARFAKIIDEEKTSTSPEQKKIVEQEILTYVKQNLIKDSPEGYVEMPYYLIIKAKRAGIGDLTNFLFSYKSTSLIVCANKADVDKKVDFSETKTPIVKEYVQNVREKFSPEEQQYINYVEKSHDRLEELRNVQGLWTHEDDLDLPRDFEIIISNKWKEREHLKKSLLACEPGIAVSDVLKKEYQGYHDFFENLYMGILSEVSSHKFTNDIDGYSYIMSVVAKMQGGFFDLENKKLLEEVLPEEVASTFQAQMKIRKVDGKNVYELYKSDKPEEKEKAIWMAKQILKSILEALVLDVGDNGEIKDINSGSNYLKLKKQFQTTFGNNLKENKFFIPPEITSSTIASIPAEQLEIKKVDKKEKNAMDKAKDVLKEIEATAADVVRQGKRGEISFDPEKKTLTSWGNTTKIDIIGEANFQFLGKKYTSTLIKIKGLDINYTLKEGIKVANLINFMKNKFKGKGDVIDPFNLSRRGSLEFNHKEGGYFDTEILDASDLEEQFPSTYKDRETFIQYLNGLRIW